ncbi:MAG: histidinol-phosphate transaminase [Actinomycetota bacterium]|nr:histidinol-phosphate transaminase [Actinomycetota bacterium]
MFEKITRPEIDGLPVYSPGLGVEEVKKRYGVERVIKLASNENPLGPSKNAVDAVRNASESMNIYPDGSCHELRMKLSEHLGVSPEMLTFGSGADELIDFIFYAFFKPGDSAVVGNPTFSSYYLSGMMMGARIVFVPLVNYRHSVEGMLDAVGKDTKGVFVGSPHNPTGEICTEDEFCEFLKGLPEDVLLVWDEAYMEFVDDSRYPDSTKYLEKHPNLIVLRTFSKAYGLAGLRIGYGIVHPEIAGYIERVRPPFNVNGLAQVAAIAALDDEEHLKKTVNSNSEGRLFLSRELKRLGFEVVPSQANFILFKYENLTRELPVKLLEKGIVVRDGEELGYSGYIRMTVGTMEENNLVVDAIEQILKKGRSLVNE